MNPDSTCKKGFRLCGLNAKTETMMCVPERLGNSTDYCPIVHIKMDDGATDEYRRIGDSHFFASSSNKLGITAITNPRMVEGGVCIAKPNIVTT